MGDQVVLSGRFVRLEPLGPAHAAGLVAAAAEDRATYGYTWVPDGPAQAEAFVAEAIAEARAGNHLPFATVRLHDERVVGSTRFIDMEPWPWPQGCARQRTGIPDAVEIGHTWLAASAQRTAINTEAKLLMMEHAFEAWAVHRVRLKTDARNARSRAAIERLGASFEGVLRAHQPAPDGSVRDTAFFSVVATEWPAVRDRLTGRLTRR